MKMFISIKHRFRYIHHIYNRKVSMKVVTEAFEKFVRCGCLDTFLIKRYQNWFIVSVYHSHSDTKFCGNIETVGYHASSE